MDKKELKKNKNRGRRKTKRTNSKRQGLIKQRQSPSFPRQHVS